MRETALEEKTRQEEARVAAIKERQIRLGHVPAPEETDEEEIEEEAEVSTPPHEKEVEPEPAPKAKAGSQKKST